MKKIIVYTSEDCSYCRELKKWLMEQNITYTNMDVNDSDVAKEFKKYNSPGIPLIIVNDNETGRYHKIVGFNPSKLSKLIF